MLNLNMLTLLMLVMAFGVKKKHILTILLTLELLTVMIILTTLNFGLELFVGVIMICIGACEGAVGLGCMISVTRIKTVHGYLVG